MNITDVGHLTSDADTGQDKMELARKRENKSAWEIAKFYTKAFQDDLKKLNILFPDIWCKATDHIKEQIDLIKTLEKKGFTYKTSDGIYFDTSKLKEYGKLAKLDIEGLQAGARIEVGEKKHPTDFSLWKFSPKNEQRQMEWKSPWNDRSFPGWHIECSAMSMKYLGETFDIHCGGIDHIPVHHTNEIAQSEAATGKKFVNYWLHGNFLVLKDSAKMAKSGKNFLTLQTIMDKGYDPLVYRYFCCTAHYRASLTFSYEAVDATRNALTSLQTKVLEYKKAKEKINKKSHFIMMYQEKFHEAINDDLDLPKALALTWEMIKDKDMPSSEKYHLLLDFDKILGLNLSKLKEEKVKVPKEILLLAEQREQARRAKNFKEADRLREEIKKKGFLMQDTNTGFKIEKQ